MIIPSKLKSQQQNCSEIKCLPRDDSLSIPLDPTRRGHFWHTLQNHLWIVKEYTSLLSTSELINGNVFINTYVTSLQRRLESRREEKLPITVTVKARRDLYPMLNSQDSYRLLPSTRGIPRMIPLIFWIAEDMCVKFLHVFPQDVKRPFSESQRPQTKFYYIFTTYVTFSMFSNIGGQKSDSTRFSTNYMSNEVQNTYIDFHGRVLCLLQYDPASFLFDFCSILYASCTFIFAKPIYLCVHKPEGKTLVVK